MERSADVSLDVVFRAAAHGDRCVRERGSGLATICTARLWCADRRARATVVF